MSRSDIAVSVRALSKSYTIARQGEKHVTLAESLLARVRRPFARAPRETFWALKDVEFDVRTGDVVGIIGRNGAGKSTLLKILSRITEPTAGKIDLYGRVGSLLEVGTGFHPELSGRENIFLNGAILGMSKAEIRAQFDAIVDFAGVERFLDTPVKRYSSGMYVRLAFAVAAHLESEVLIVDEVLAVGDVSFQKKCLTKIESEAASGRTVLLVTHSIGTISRICKKAVLLDGGRVLFHGHARDAVHHYLGTEMSNRAERIWAEPSKAPGDSTARLYAVRTVDNDRHISSQFAPDEDINIEVEYDQLAATCVKPLTVSLHVINEGGVTIFVSNDFENPIWFARDRSRGRVRAVCRVPRDLLALGTYTVLAAVCTYDPNIVHALEHAAVAFEISDINSLASPHRVHFAGEWPGIIRPRLDWNATYVS